MMRYACFYLFFFLFTFLNSSFVYADDHVATEGYLLQDLKTHVVLSEKESSDYFRPASTLKLFTAFTALTILGPDFQYKTQIFFNPHLIKDGVLNGNVTLVFSGDPLLKTSDLDDLLLSLKDHGLHRINGNVDLVTNAFDDRPYGDGWPWDQTHICYSGPVHTVNLDQNCLLFHVFPSANQHSLDLPASVQCSQASEGQPCVINKAISGDDENCSLLFDHDDNQYTLSGCLPMGGHSERMKLSIPNGALYAKGHIIQQLNNHHIALQGSVIMNAPMPKGEAIKTHYSYPVKKLVRIMLKFSDDLIANALFKTFGAHYYHAQGTWSRGINAEKAILHQLLGFNPKEVFIFDGSGESYYDAISPQQMMRLLTYIYNTPSLSQFIIPALPVNGVDGTLIGRLHEYPPIIHAKTGTWRDVAALSGYITKYNTQWAFVIFVNGMSPISRADINQLDVWMKKILPPPAHSLAQSGKSGKNK